MLLPLAYLLFGIGVYCRTVQDSDHGVPIVRNAEKSFVELDIDSEELVDLHDDQPRDVDESSEALNEHSKDKDTPLSTVLALMSGTHNRVRPLGSRQWRLVSADRRSTTTEGAMVTGTAWKDIALQIQHAKTLEELKQMGCIQTKSSTKDVCLLKDHAVVVSKKRLFMKVFEAKPHLKPYTIFRTELQALEEIARTGVQTVKFHAQDIDTDPIFPVPCITKGTTKGGVTTLANIRRAKEHLVTYEEVNALAQKERATLCIAMVMTKLTGIEIGGVEDIMSDIEDQWSQELIEVEQQTSKAGIDKALHNFQRISESGLVIKDVQGFVSSEGGFTLADPGPVFKLGDKLHRLDNLETVRPSVYDDAEAQFNHRVGKALEIFRSFLME